MALHCDIFAEYWQWKKNKKLKQVSSKHLIIWYKKQENDLWFQTVKQCRDTSKTIKLELIPEKMYPGSYSLNEANCSHFLLCNLGFSLSSLSAGSRTDQGRRASSQHLSLLSKENALPVCPAFESITPPNRLIINAHTADYISDGYLGGKHLNDSTNRHSTVTEPCQVCHRAASVDSRAHSATTQLCQFLVETDIYAILVPSNVGNLRL